MVKKLFTLDSSSDFYLRRKGIRGAKLQEEEQRLKQLNHPLTQEYSAYPTMEKLLAFLFSEIGKGAIETFETRGNRIYFESGMYIQFLTTLDEARNVMRSHEEYLPPIILVPHFRTDKFKPLTTKEKARRYHHAFLEFLRIAILISKEFENTSVFTPPTHLVSRLPRKFQAHIEYLSPNFPEKAKWEAMRLNKLNKRTGSNEPVSPNKVGILKLSSNQLNSPDLVEAN